jgi:HEPN domain-containing protein
MPKTSNARAMSFFRAAREFFSAAEELFALESGPQTTRRRVSPIYFCYAQAVELALKAFLRSHNPEVEFGHHLTTLYKDCVALGFVIGPDDLTQIANVVALLDAGNEDAGFRYFMGPGIPDLAWTHEVVGQLIEAVEPDVRRDEKKYPPPSHNIVGFRSIFGKPTKQGPKA